MRGEGPDPESVSNPGIFFQRKTLLPDTFLESSVMREIKTFVLLVSATCMACLKPFHPEEDAKPPSNSYG